MNIPDIRKQHDKIIGLILKRQLKDVLDRLTVVSNQYPFGEHRLQLEKYLTIYSQLLTYTFKGVDDPHRDTVYNTLLRNLLELADAIFQYVLFKESSLPAIKEKSKLMRYILTAADIKLRLEELSVNYELQNILKQSEVSLNTDQQEQKSQHEISLKDVFNRLWLKDVYTETEEELVHRISQSNSIPWFEKCVFVSAITLSLSGYFAPNKIDLLLEFVMAKEEQVWQRALTGIILVLMQHDKRLYLYPETIQKLRGAFDEEMLALASFVVVQVIKTDETEKLTQEFENELVPELIKNAPQLTEKLNLDNLINKDMDEDENPDWHKAFFDNEDLYNKIEKFSELQMDGSDVFMSAFSRLKHFSFFNEIHHWFLPFHIDNEYFTSLNEKAEKSFIEALTYAPFICNSDKYSFILNISKLPTGQFEMVKHLFSEEMLSLKADQESIPDEESKSKSIITQYLQDFYRYIRLYPGRFEFVDLLKIDLDFTKAYSSQLLFPDVTTFEKVANLYFQNAQYPLALPIYLYLEKQGSPSQEIFQKAAFCYQKMKDYGQALQYYQKANLFDKSSVWNNNKIAYCYKQMQDYKNAIKYYSESLKMQDDNLNVEANIARCYLDLKDYKNALRHYFKVEYLTPEKENITRPIAWCYFNMKEFDTALTYYRKISVENLTHFDMMNIGHIYWCLSQANDAVEYYKKCFVALNNDLKKFISNFIGDKDQLIQNGINENDFPLMLDYIRMKLND